MHERALRHGTVALAITLAVGGGAAGLTSSASAAGRSCGHTGPWFVQAGASTSCPFARNVARKYHGRSRTFVAYSPTTGRSYTVRCRGNSDIATCRGGSGAVVTLSAPGHG